MTLQHTIIKALAITALLLPTMAAHAVQPKWVTDSSLEYPNTMYLVGRGTGSTAEEAQNRARGDLATIFEVRIEVVNQNTTTVAQSNQQKEQIDRLSSQQVSATTDKVINGINIAEIWRDPVTQDFHALATLSRAQASASLREELAKIDDGLKQQMQTAQSEPDALLKVGSLSKALQASITREGFQASLKVIDPSGRGVRSPFSQVEVQQQIDSVLKKIRIAPEVVEDDGAREFAKLVKGGLAAAGFLPTSHANADLILQSKLSMSDLGQQNGWNWMRATVEIALVEKETGRVRGSQTWPLKASARDAKTARKRILIEIEKAFKEELRSTVVEFASS